MLSGIDFFSSISMVTTQPSSLRETPTTPDDLRWISGGNSAMSLLTNWITSMKTASWLDVELLTGPRLPPARPLYRNIDCRGDATHLSTSRCRGRRDSSQEVH